MPWGGVAVTVNVVMSMVVCSDWDVDIGHDVDLGMLLDEPCTDLSKYPSYKFRDFYFAMWWLDHCALKRDPQAHAQCAAYFGTSISTRPRALLCPHMR